MRYKHYKGGIYNFIGTTMNEFRHDIDLLRTICAKHTEKNETVFVGEYLYESGKKYMCPGYEPLVIYEDRKGDVWARPEEMFHGYLENGTKRFVLLQVSELADESSNASPMASDHREEIRLPEGTKIRSKEDGQVYTIHTSTATDNKFGYGVYRYRLKERLDTGFALYCNWFDVIDMKQVSALLAQEVEILLRELAWYADPKTYLLGVTISMGSAFATHEPIKADKGERAKEIIRQIRRPEH